MVRQQQQPPGVMLVLLFTAALAALLGTLLARTAHALHYGCDSKHVRTFRFRSVMGLFQDPNKRSDRQPFETEFLADVDLSCSQSFEKPGSRRQVHLYELRLRNVKINQEVDKRVVDGHDEVDHLAGLPDALPVPDNKALSDAFTSRSPYVHRLRQADKVERLEALAEAKVEEQQREMAEMFRGKTTFVLSSAGQVLKVMHDREEHALSTHFKKQIISLLQTNFHAEERDGEVDAVGRKVARYRRVVGTNGTETMEKTFTERDVALAEPGKRSKTGLSPRNHVLKNTEYVQVDSEGRPTRADARRKVTFGERKNVRGNGQHARVEFQNADEAQSFRNPLEFDSQSELKLVGERRIRHEEHDEVHRLHRPRNARRLNRFESESDGSLRFELEGDAEHPEFELHDSLAETDLQLDDRLLDFNAAVRAIQSRRAMPHPEQALEMLETDPKNVHLLARVQNWAHYHAAEAVPLCVQRYRQVLERIAREDPDVEGTDADRLSGLLNALQSVVYAASRSKYENDVAQQGVLELFKATTDPRVLPPGANDKLKSLLLTHLVQRVVDLDRPSRLVVDGMLRRLSSHMNDEVVSQKHGMERQRELGDVELDDELATNAYLSMAATASKMVDHDAELAEELADEVLDHVERELASVSDEKLATDEGYVLHHVHALGNLGSALPIHVTSSVLFRPRASQSPSNEPVQLALIEGLAARHPNESYVVDAVLHRVMRDRKLGERVRATAVKVLHELHDHHDRMPTEQTVHHLGETFVSARQDGHEMLAALTHKFLADHAHFHEQSAAALSDVEYIMAHDLSLPADTDVPHQTALADFMHENSLDAQALGLHDQEMQVMSDAKFLRRAWRRVRRAVRRVVRVVTKPFTGVIDKIRRGIDKFKRKFSPYTIGNPRCYPISSRRETMCLKHPGMQSFVGKFRLNRINWQKSFSWERGIGVQVLHAYAGLVGYVGHGLSCNKGRNANLDAIAFGRGAAKGHAFGKDFNILVAQFEMGRSGGANSQFHDNMYVRVLRWTIVNKGFMPAKAKQWVSRVQDGAGSLCVVDKKKNLVKKTYPNLVSFQVDIPIVIVITLGMSASGEIGVDLKYSACLAQLKVGGSVEPYFKLGAFINGGVSIFVARATIDIGFSTRQGLVPEIGTEGCSLCGQLYLRSTYPHIHVRVSVKVSKLFDKAWTIYEARERANNMSIIRKRCLGFK